MKGKIILILAMAAMLSGCALDNEAAVRDRLQAQVDAQTAANNAAADQRRHERNVRDAARQERTYRYGVHRIDCDNPDNAGHAITCQTGLSVRSDLSGAIVGVE